MKQKRYVVGYIEYQHCAFGDDSYDGWGVALIQSQYLTTKFQR